MSEPYLSLVVAARNDDHGGNLLDRMQAFVNGWIAQARAHRISCELVIVEWNPDPGRPPLRDALHWPRDLGPCEVRFIEVPPELHQRYGNAAALPLYQMIAKNVGIRHSRGKFVLAANIDLLFSSELAAFLGEHRLEPGRMYRLDRYDVMSGVPVDAPVEEQLAYCRTHLIRVNTRHGTFALTPEGDPAPCKNDIAEPSSGIRFSTGWYPPEEITQSAVFRWAGKDAEVLLGAPPQPGATLFLDVKPGPALRGAPLQLTIKTATGRLLFQDFLSGRKRLRIPVPEPAPGRVFLHSAEGGDPLQLDPRLLTMQAFQLDWGPRFHAPGGFFHRLNYPLHLLRLIAGKLTEERPTFTLPSRNPAWVRALAGAYAAHGPVEVQDACPIPPSPELLHTTASGDFTLMAREHWLDLRGYPEFDVFPMNLDSILCYAAHYGGAREEILPDPMRIYHIEHALGSGWTPEGKAILFARLARQGVSFIPYDDVLRWASYMRQLQSPMIFNREDWGLARFDLKETGLPTAFR